MKLIDEMIELTKSGKKLNYENLMKLNITKTTLQKIEDYDWQRNLTFDGKKCDNKKAIITERGGGINE